VATQRRRLDAELVRRGLADSRQNARLRIEAGDVLVGGSPADKPARLVSAGEPIELQGPPPQFVGRGGVKLAAALEAFDVEVAGAAAVDVGASTGGFTDCLLQHGAASVVALDVGHGQLHERLRSDPRVTVLERCNVRDLAPGRCDDATRARLVGPPAPLVVADLSFISLRTVADALAALAAPGAAVIVLIKPQFEAGHRTVARGRGVVTDPVVWEQVVHDVIEGFAAHQLCLVDLLESPLRGASGNVEFLGHFRHAADPGPADAITRAQVADVVAGAVGSPGAVEEAASCR